MRQHLKHLSKVDPRDVKDIIQQKQFYDQGTRHRETIKEIKEIHGMRNTGVSCYMDSVIMCLLTVPNPVVDSMILYSRQENSEVAKLQHYLRDIATQIRAGETVENSKRISSAFGNLKIQGFEDFSVCRQREAGEFLQYIFLIFKMDCIASTETVTFGTNDLDHTDNMTTTSFLTNDRMSCSWLVDSFKILSLADKRVYESKDFLATLEDSGELEPQYMFKPVVGDRKMKFKRRITQVKFVYSKYLVMWFQRNHFGQFLDTKYIVPSKNLILKCGRVLHLYSIIVFSGRDNSGHYTAYLKVGDDVWFFYDDNASQMVKFDSFNSMLHHSPSPVTNSTLLFYS